MIRNSEAEAKTFVLRAIKSRSRWISPAASRPSPEGSGGYALDLAASSPVPSDFFIKARRSPAP
jgi:hypothetical protein